jgi:hypothetical protein
MAQINNYEPVEVRTSDGWIVISRPVPWADEQELWIGKLTNGKIYQGKVGEHGNLVLEEISEGTETTPALRINRMAWMGLVQALKGVMPDLDKKEVDAELKATKYHLEDMRKLAFKKQK